MKKISDEQFEKALTLFRDSVHEFEFRPTVERSPSPSFAGWRFAVAAFAMIAILIAGVPMYRQHQNDLANAATQQAKMEAQQDDALLREVESDVSYSVPPPMRKLQLLMATDSTTTTTEILK
jgi:hypothetical protein